MGNIVAIGYGNDLRSDDGIGQRVANTLQLSNVKSLAVHQLTPELAEILANADLAIFIDACLTSESSEVQVRSLSPNSSNIIAGPGENFAIGDRLSPIAETGVAIALEKIAQIINS